MVAWISSNLDNSIIQNYENVLALLKNQGLHSRHILLIVPQSKNPFLAILKRTNLLYQVITIDTELELFDVAGLKLLPARQLSQEQVDVLIHGARLLISEASLIQRYVSYGIPLYSLSLEADPLLRKIIKRGFKKILFPVVRPEDEDKTFDNLLKYCKETRSSITLFHKATLNKYSFDFGEPVISPSLELFMNHYRLSVLSSWILKATSLGVSVQIHPDQAAEGFEKSLLDILAHEYYDYVAFDPSLFESFFWNRMLTSLCEKSKFPIWIPGEQLQVTKKPAASIEKRAGSSEKSAA